jgi:hypothetical protein
VALGLIEAGEELVGVFEQRLARSGERKAAGRAFHQRHTQLVLELVDVVRDRRLRERQRPGRPRERALRCNLPEDAKPVGIQWHKPTLP